MPRVLVLALLSAALGLAQTAPPAVRLSADKTYLVNAAGDPFFINGDTAWSLLVQLTREDAELYLESRRQKGYNVILVNLLEHKFASQAPSNLYGDAPFTTPGDFSTPNEAYFAHVDWVLNKAAEKGITVLLDAIYLGYKCGDEGWCAEVAASSPGTMRGFGQYVGNRYRNFPNIIWVIGGDTNPMDHGVGPKVSEMVAGMRQHDTAHLYTAHNGPEQSAQDVWNGSAWLGLNDIYSYTQRTDKVHDEYSRPAALPMFLIESAYENEHHSTPFTLRRTTYSNVLWGARLGHLFGNCPMWAFGAAPTFCSGNWKDQLDSPGSRQLAYVGQLLNSRRHYLLRPDYSHTVMTAGYGSGQDLATTSRATDGSSILAYLPTSRMVTINLSALSGTTARAWWFDPRTTATTLIGAYPTNNPATFTPPDAQDWVLVLDDAALNLPAPGNH
jgi:Protein of unknown function (DUF4038)/Putative collagen-binding domain of a collagenase